MSRKPNFEPSNDVHLLYAELKKIGIGQTISYAEISRIVGRSVTNGAAHVLQSARRRLERNDQIIFGTITGEGIKRLSDVEIVASGQSQIDRVRRASRRAFRRLECVRDFDAMPEKERTRHNALQTMFGALATVTKASAVAKVESAVAQEHQRLPLAKTLALFAK